MHSKHQPSESLISQVASLLSAEKYLPKSSNFSLAKLINYLIQVVRNMFY